MREQFRVWAETLETFVLEVIFEERRGVCVGAMRAFLLGGSKLFTLAVKARRWLYNVRILVEVDPGSGFLGQIQFTGYAAGATWISGLGEIVPVPEPINVALGVSLM